LLWIIPRIEHDYLTYEQWLRYIALSRCWFFLAAGVSYSILYIATVLTRIPEMYYNRTVLHVLIINRKKEGKNMNEGKLKKLP
jgi:hypothetical protein